MVVEDEELTGGVYIGGARFEGLNLGSYTKRPRTLERMNLVASCC